jgi:hypothetical protein
VHNHQYRAPAASQPVADAQMRAAQREARFRTDCFEMHLANAAVPCMVCGGEIRGALPDYPVMHARCGHVPKGNAPADIEKWFDEVFS